MLKPFISTSKNPFSTEVDLLTDEMSDVTQEQPQVSIICGSQMARAKQNFKLPEDSFNYSSAYLIYPKASSYSPWFSNTHLLHPPSSKAATSRHETLSNFDVTPENIGLQ
jgi:hypothetical protein